MHFASIRQTTKTVVLSILLAIYGILTPATASQAKMAATIETLWSSTPELIRKLRDPPEGVGWVLYRPLSDAWRIVTVRRCQIKVEMIAINDDGTEAIISEISFDLSRSTLPDPLRPDPDFYDYQYVATDKSGWGYFGVLFTAPYQPLFVQFLPTEERSTPFSGANFSMPNLKSEDHIRDLLTALNAYQEKFCASVS